jgi:hypothetical protein
MCVGFLNCPEGQKRVGKNYFFFAPDFNQRTNIIISIFQILNQVISVELGLSALHTTACGMKRCAF